jgi:ATP-binding cassette, subfamily B, bacterial
VAFAASKIDVFALFSLLLIQSASIPLSIYLGKIAIDSVATSVPVLPIVLFWGLSIALGMLIDPFIFLFTGSLNEKIIYYVSNEAVKKINSLEGLSHFENTTFYDKIQLVSEQAAYRPLNMIISLIDFIGGSMTLVGFIILLGTLNWWIPIILILSIFPFVLVSTKLQELSFKIVVQNQLEVRKMDYFRQVMTSLNFAKEIRIFSLGDFFRSKLQESFESLFQINNKDRKRQAISPLPTIVLYLAANTVAFSWIVNSSRDGKLTPGSMLIFVQTLFQFQQKIGLLASTFSNLVSASLFFEEYEVVMAYKSDIQTGSEKIFINQEIVFENVSFSYPDGRIALNNITFSVQKGEKIALVGENGAGKSTIVKLICRFYDPSAGKILIDGKNLANLDLSYWRSKITAVFQDFCRYNLTLGENIIFDKDLETVRSVHSVGLTEFVNSLPDALNTNLGTQFGGTELSGGQWQKIALARAYAREGSDILILDEPTASLDPKAEYEVYKDFVSLSEKRTVFLITHRLRSVRMADRIFVLKDGAIVETGTHEKLMEINGEYAEMYNLQSKDDFSPIT